MFRIHIEEQARTTTIYLEGKLTADNVDELRKVWAAVCDRSAGKEIVIDLCSVRIIDRAGKELLSQIYTAGTRLAGNGLCVAPLIQEIAGTSLSKYQPN
jgi:anti-anti-sigma regulatory factor